MKRVLWISGLAVVFATGLASAQTGGGTGTGTGAQQGTGGDIGGGGPSGSRRGGMPGMGGAPDEGARPGAGRESGTRGVTPPPAGDPATQPGAGVPKVPGDPSTEDTLPSGDD